MAEKFDPRKSDFKKEKISLEEVKKEFYNYIHKYQKVEVIGRKNLRPGDCSRVAISAILPIKKFLAEKGIRLNTVKVGTISVDEKTRIPRFKNMGFTTHVINYIQFPNGECLAFDLTAKYNLPDENVEIKFFKTKNKKDLNFELKGFYNTRNSWD